MCQEKLCGIYSITNLYNKKIYIGQSNNIRKRISEHRCELNNNYHHNVYLQNAWTKYGEVNFEFEIIELCVEDKLSEREIFYIQKFNSADRKFGYNLTLGGEGKRGFHLSDEVKNNIRNGRKNFKHSAETKKRISEAQKGRPLTEEWKKNISEAQKRRIANGKYPSTDGFKRYNELNQTAINCYDLDGNFICKFSGIQVASRYLGIEATNICKVLKKKHKSCKGYYFTYATEKSTPQEVTAWLKSGRSYDHVALVDDAGRIIKEFENCEEAAKELNLFALNIYNVCAGTISQVHGHKFRYVS